MQAGGPRSTLSSGARQAGATAETCQDCCGRRQAGAPTPLECLRSPPEAASARTEGGRRAQPSPVRVQHPHVVPPGTGTRPALRGAPPPHPTATATAHLQPRLDELCWAGERRCKAAAKGARQGLCCKAGAGAGAAGRLPAGRGVPGRRRGRVCRPAHELLAGLVQPQPHAWKGVGVGMGCSRKVGAGVGPRKVQGPEGSSREPRASANGPACQAGHGQRQLDRPPAPHTHRNAWAEAPPPRQHWLPSSMPNYSPLLLPGIAASPPLPVLRPKGKNTHQPPLTAVHKAPGDGWGQALPEA